MMRRSVLFLHIVDCDLSGSLISAGSQRSALGAKKLGVHLGDLFEHPPCFSRLYLSNKLIKSRKRWNTMEHFWVPMEHDGTFGRFRWNRMEHSRCGSGTRRCRRRRREKTATNGHESTRIRMRDFADRSDAIKARATMIETNPILFLHWCPFVPLVAVFFYAKCNGADDRISCLS
jgi:hypothetical protein